ncbi:CD70 antigen [Galemys pyrenaicus]|uniref:CD70 antigen n=1 Tax=Galemys pyrenaicus TaxID=202257 RepID=A0A8J6AE02_GALPY|nr:CD70 antigen [Galemys pyrenaicus]
MAEERPGCPLPRLPFALSFLRVAWQLFFLGAAAFCFYRCLAQQQQQQRCEPAGGDIAELQLNHTGLLRQDPRLHWQGGPALGRSYLHGPQLDNGQLRVQRNGIYRLHVQVTLTNCSSWTQTTRLHRATLTVGICYPTARSISLLRIKFHGGCTVASQRLTPLFQGDTLCTNLTLPLLPSPNADETFFGVQWVQPF